MEFLLFQNADLTAVLVFVCTFLLVYYSTRRPAGIPPGPKLFPVVGNLPQFGSGDLLGQLDKLRKQYGDIYGLYLGKKLHIYLNGHDFIQEAFLKRGSTFVGRPRRTFDNYVDIHYGVVFAIGKQWKEQRGFTLTSLQELCFKNSGRPIEHGINEEISHLLEMLQNTDGPVDTEDCINISIFNAMCKVLLQHRYGFEDGKIRMILGRIRKMFQNHVMEQILTNCLPFPLDFLIVCVIGLPHRTYVLSFMKPLIDEIKESDDCIAGNSFVSMYLRRIEENKLNGVQDTFTEEQLQQTTFDMIVAGSETTANTIRWILLYLIRNPEIQEKMFQEISVAIGTETPSIADREKLPYVQAVIFEGLRIQPVAPLGLPHTAFEDTMLGGFLIPKNCSVMANITSVSWDPELFPEPKTFRPERFLNEDKTEVEIPKQFIPFSLGPRSCLGETFAKVEIFLYITALVQKFRLLPEKDGELPDLEAVLGLTLSPKAYKLRTVAR